MQTNTIAAIATAVSNSGIGIIRISGEEAFEIIDRIFQSKNSDKKLSDAKSHTIHYGFIMDGKEIIDEVLVSIMRAPNTYTRENVVEINCHGGVVVVNRVLETVLKYGARTAEPGEFTKRAFLNGRIDLSQAEAVMDVIAAKNDFALQSSVSQLQGTVSDKIKEIRADILENIAFIEAALDDPEHISLEGFDERLNNVVLRVEKQLHHMIQNFDNGRIRSEGVKTVILGKPNAGKSSLLNILLGEERAIVTDIEGTTRDALEERANVNGITLNIVDTAGIRQTQDVVEQIGVSRAKEHAKDADLILYVIDRSRELDENDYQIMKLIHEQGKEAIILFNKSDLNTVVNKKDLNQWLEGRPIIEFSAKDRSGLDDLTEEIKKLFYQDKISFNDQVYITNARQKQAITKAYESMKLVEQSLENHMPEDFYSIDLMDAYEALGTIIGEAVEDDVVDEIFRKFCMGK